MPLINFSGLASGIDTNALIDAISEASRTQRIAPLERQITELTDTNDALSELKSKLSTLQSKIRLFSTLSGGGVAKQASSNDETVITATAGNSARAGSYTVTVSQLAKNATASFDARYASSSTAVLATINDGLPDTDRTATVTVGTGGDMETVNIVMTSTMTVAQWVDQFNTNSSKAEASLVNVGTPALPSYAIVINSVFTGTQKGQVAISGGLEVTAWATDNTLSQATNSKFTVSGIDATTEIERSTNSVSDVIPGLTMNFESTGTATISVSNDTATTSSRIKDFVDAYNEIVTYINENDIITQEQDGSDIKNIFGPLTNTSTDDNAIGTLRAAIASAVATDGSIVRIFADLGITTARDGTLEFDEDDFTTAMGSEPASVDQLLTRFADTTSITGGTIDVLIRFNGTFDITLNSNKSRITDLNDDVSEAEKSILANEDSLRQRFARLESLMARLQNQQSALTSALAGLSGGGR